ncbi:hypothetical protein [Chromatocurvus halotolerans]|uniref:DUF2946 family protein n=1 Tax=Chromatocurvus halotolerans TaxID=1132028 RepID=A0A4R2KF74_9GAMM|nr:hypothetical protein [Chromatocurvus halotolerans]TCO72213.1 hypothetical protein EV688_11914 [Chromatocurvus halotolerans]
MLLIQTLQRARRPIRISLCVLAYLVAAAVVPSGYMAAPLASGTPFHLCPGDTRSALIISALTDSVSLAHQYGDPHAGHHGAGADISVSPISAEPDCQFAGVSALPAGLAFADADAPESISRVQRAPGGPATRNPAWLRPPVRSPPA